jgi:hypothetical protein
VIFDHNTKHGAWGGGARRRMYTMNFCNRFPEEDIGLFIKALVALDVKVIQTPRSIFIFHY